MAETQNTGQFAKTIVTDVGKDMIAKSQNGQTLTFSRVALGDGLVGEEEDVTKFTAVKNERLSLPIAKYSNLGNGQFQIQFRLTNSQVESGFWHREIGIMAKIDNGQEQLYAYTTAGNKASFIYDKTTPVEERIVNVNFVIGNAQNLEVIINSSVIYATIEDLEEALDAHDAGADAHEPAFDAHNAADDAHKDFTGATAEAAGERGMVPAPAAGDQNKALFGDKSYKSVVQSVNDVVADGAGNVTIDIPKPVIATEEEAETGINNTKFMTPLRVKQAIEKFAPVKSVNGVLPDENGNIQINDIYTNPNLTLLWKADISQEYYKGDITLSEAYTNYKALLIETVCQNSYFVGTEIVPVWELQYRKSMVVMDAGQEHNSGFFLTNGEEYYILDAQQSTTTFLKFVLSHGYLRAIYGIK